MIDYIFFFSSRRRHTRCGRDWSSDVCSSDLHRIQRCPCLLTRLCPKRGQRCPGAFGRNERTTVFLHGAICRFLPRGRRQLQQKNHLKGDRKSTRLNSSHVRSSYAVFCLKKKTSRWPMSGVRCS